MTKGDDSYTVVYGITNVMAKYGAIPSPSNIYHSTAVIKNDTEEIWVLDEPLEALLWFYITKSGYITYETYQTAMDKYLIFKFEITAPNEEVQTICNYSTVTDFKDSEGYRFPNEDNFHIYPPEFLDGDYYANAPIPVSTMVVLNPGESMSVSWKFGIAYESGNETQGAYMDFNFRLRFHPQATSPMPTPTPTPTPKPTPTPSASTSNPENLNPSATPSPSPTPIFIDEHFAYVVGYPDGTVKPENSITRAEVTTVFFRPLTDSVRDANWAQNNNYSDVPSTDWFNNAVSTMSKMHIVNGYSDGTFKPNGYITRAELAAIASRFARQSGALVTNSPEFSDIDDSWAEAEILYAASVGWVNGYPDGTFKPNRSVTRAEFMALVNRMLERDPEFESDIITAPPQEWLRLWSDNSDVSAWYYLDVQEATNSHYYVRKGKTVPTLSFNYETWTALREPRDWTELER
ncbi:MAG: S-layer homology domain-containing protein [Oscillospiraceae bacterium]|nr:S-layer homology domain-containing protein [Oscillospiraceae bacterium]